MYPELSDLPLSLYIKYNLIKSIKILISWILNSHRVSPVYTIRCHFVQFIAFCHYLCDAWYRTKHWNCSQIPGQVDEIWKEFFSREVVIFTNHVDFNCRSYIFYGKILIFLDLCIQIYGKCWKLIVVSKI